jgi:endonuclease/exonuclease/phosphatase family metal-dependent hydrolase
MEEVKMVKMIVRGVVALMVLLTFSLTAVHAQPTDELTVVAWNVFSGSADPQVIRQRLAAFEGIDLWALTEVTAGDAATYEAGAEDGENAPFDSILSASGGADRQLIIFSADRLELRRKSELDNIRLGSSGLRAPLVAEFRDKVTGQDFLFVAIHLCSCRTAGDEVRRHQQATLLREWALDQTLPVILAGDFNFDWNPVNGESDHDLGYDNLTLNGSVEWVRPPELATTQCDIQGNGCRFNSVLDFVFVAGSAQDWGATSEILIADFPLPFATGNSDHRPLKTIFTFGAIVVEPVVTKAMLLEKIAALETEIAALRDLVEQLP